MSKINEFGLMLNNFGKSMMQKYSAAFGQTSPYRRVGDRFPTPRKGEQGNLSTAASSSLGYRLPEKKITRHMILAPQTLRRLGDTDPITWSIKRTRRHQISHARWDIVDDLDNFYQEVDKWQEILFDNLNNWGYKANIALRYIPEDLYGRYKSELDSVFNSGTNKYDQKARIKWIMKSLIREKKDRAHKHAEEVKRIFNRPCNEYSTMGSLMEILVDDMIVFDSGVLIKNKDRVGRLAELYPIPGEEVFMYRNEDRTIPEPPEAAYLWEESGSKKAEFDRDEVIYVMCNPQHNFYGRSAVETSAYVITTSLYADSYNMDYFKYSDVPPGILDLGKDINDDQRRAFKAAYEAEKAGRGGIFRMMFISGSDGAQFIPLRTMTQKDMQLQEYLKWSLSIKCACHQISPQDIGFTMDLHRTTSETQYQISRDNGLRIMLEKLSHYWNNDILKKEYPTYNDIKFKYLDMDTVDEVTKNNMAAQKYEGGIITLNETREELNLQPVPGGDVLCTQKIPGQGFMPVSLLEKEADNMEMAVEQQATQAEEGAQQGLQQDENGNPIETNPSEVGTGDPSQQQPGQPQQEQQPGKKPAHDPAQHFQPTTVGMNKLQKAISDMRDGQTMSVSFRPTYQYGPSQDDMERRRKQLEGFKAGLSDPTLQAAANVFSHDENERVLGTYALVGLGTVPIGTAAYYGTRGMIEPAAQGVSRSVKTLATRFAVPYTHKNKNVIIESAAKLAHRMEAVGAGTISENSKIIGAAINAHRGAKSLREINGISSKIVGRAAKMVRLGLWRIK